MHLVAKLDHLTPPYEMSVCSYGIMGSRFVRTEPAPATVQVDQGSTTTLMIDHVYSEIEIGTKLAIDLRHADGK